MQRDRAETLALQALTFIAADEDRMGRFLALSGMGPDELKARIGDPGFLGGILDHLLAYEPDLIAFAESIELDPGEVMRARHLLPGATPDW